MSESAGFDYVAAKRHDYHNRNWRLKKNRRLCCVRIRFWPLKKCLTSGIYRIIKKHVSANADGWGVLFEHNCPHHIRFIITNRAARDLPLCIAEYGECYRNGFRHAAGLLRVRGMSMNDAHIYCRKDQIEDEFQRVMRLTMKHFAIFGLKDYWFRLSLWSAAHTEKYINEPENWSTQDVFRV